MLQLCCRSEACTNDQNDHMEDGDSQEDHCSYDAWPIQEIISFSPLEVCRAKRTTDEECFLGLLCTASRAQYRWM